MIRFAVQDGHCSVDLLHEEHADHLVGECHLAQADLFVAPLMYGVREAVRSSNDEDEPFRSCCHLLLHPSSKVHACPFAAVFVEEYHVISGLETFLDEFALSFLLLALAKTFGVLRFWNDLDGKGNVVPDALDILIYDGFEALVRGFAHHYEHAFHSSPSSSGGATYS